MAVKDIEDASNMVIDIKLIDGDFHAGCDIPSKFLGDNAAIVSCWIDGKIMVFPIHRVKWFAIYEKQ
jgi:hypothetical protein